MPFAFKIENRIDHVLEDPWASDGAFLRHVPDDEDGNIPALAPLHETSGAFPDLRNAPGRRGDLVDGHGLNRIDDQQRRRHGIGARQNLVQISAGEDKDLSRVDAEAICAESDLLRRLLCRHVEHRPLHVRQSRRRLQDQGRLADARVAPDENQGSRHQPPAKDTIQLGDRDRNTLDRGGAKCG